MSLKMKGKLLVDILMTGSLLGLMAYSLLGEEIHEWLGIMMFFFAILHKPIMGLWITKGTMEPLPQGTDYCDGTFVFNYDGIYDQRNFDFPVCIFFFTNQWRKRNGQADTLILRLLGICADEFSPGITLENDSRNFSETIWHWNVSRKEQSSQRSSIFNGGLWSLCFL